MLLSELIKSIRGSELFNSSNIDVINITSHENDIYITYKDFSTGGIDCYCINCNNHLNVNDSKLTKLCIYSNNIKLSNSSFIVKDCIYDKLVLYSDDIYIPIFTQVMTDDEVLSGIITVYLEDTIKQIKVEGLKVVKISDNIVECKFKSLGNADTVYRNC